MSSLVPLFPPHGEEAEVPPVPVPARMRGATELSRMGALSQMQAAFDIIGGVNRFALWANASPDKFYPLWARAMMPATSVNVVADNAKIEIVHSLPATDLDKHS